MAYIHILKHGSSGAADVKGMGSSPNRKWSNIYMYSDFKLSHKLPQANINKLLHMITSRISANLHH
jgi:hypothetical protein